MSDCLLIDITDGLATLTLNRPDRLNAFNGELLSDLLAAVRRLGDDPAVRAVMITGAGRGFCAGADLSDPSVLPQNGGMLDLGALLEDKYNAIFFALRRMPKPVICAVNGPAAGAGMSLALAGDIVIAAHSAYFMQAFARLGLVPDMGSTWLLPRLVGRARAMGMVMLADKVEAERAADWGLIWQAVPDEGLMETATALARQMAAGPTVGLGKIKQAMEAAETADLVRQMQLEADLQREAGRTKDFIEGVTAFQQKREPKFSGT